jgi:tripartite-type tricarboxylate transporter receptor subunit TctC
LLKFALRSFAIIVTALAAAGTLAQSYPSQPVRIVIGFPPGGTTDVIGRLVAQGLAESLGKSFIVDNRGGASGTIGTGIVAKAEPTGYTLTVVSSTHGTAPALYSSLPYQEKDLAPAGLIATTPYVFVVHPTIPANTFQELLALLRQSPGKYSFASSSPGTAQHLGGELVKRMASVDMVHVPYKGTGVLLPDLLSGRVPMMFENVAIMTPHIRKGSLRPLAVSSAKRTPLLPDVPTVAESGLGGFEVLGWFALLAPAGTPPPVIKMLNAEVNKLIVKPSVVERFAALGAEPLGGTPERTAAFIRNEQEKWGKVIRDSGIKAD